MQHAPFLLGKNPRLLTDGLSPIGFRPPPPRDSVRSDVVLTYSNDRHMAVVAGSGQGKSRAMAITNLLTYPGPALVLDVKSELYHVTARARRQMGHEVVCLDPALLTGSTHALNPFDIFGLAIASLELEAQSFSQLLAEEHQSVKDPFWHISATAVNTGLIGYMVSCLPPPERTLTRLRQLLHADDTIYSLASLLDTKGKTMNRVAYEELAALLQMPDQNTRPSVLATAQSFLKAFVSHGVEAATHTTSFSLEDWIAGKPITIYIIIPPYRFEALKGLFKIWIVTLAMACMSRTQLPDLPTFFLLDEAAMLGSFDYLRYLHAIGRGFGLRLLTCWQSLGQLQAYYPEGWRENLDNCGVIQAFGNCSFLTATELAKLTGVSPRVWMNLAPQEQIVCLEGQTLLAEKMDYLHDDRFRGLYDPNPFYGSGGRPRQ